LSKPTTSEYVRGSLYGITAVSMWTTWILAVRFGIRTSLTPWDITAIRFGVAGLILLPYLLRKGLAVDRLGWTGLAAIMAGGAPTVLVSYGGLVFAPAAHAASLFTALIPFMGRVKYRSFSLRGTARHLLVCRRSAEDRRRRSRRGRVRNRPGQSVILQSWLSDQLTFYPVRVPAVGRPRDHNPVCCGLDARGDGTLL